MEPIQSIQTDQPSDMQSRERPQDWQQIQKGFCILGCANQHNTQRPGLAQALDYPTPEDTDHAGIESPKED